LVVTLLINACTFALFLLNVARPDPDMAFSEPRGALRAGRDD
jgi:hypothetical protein